MDKKEIILPRLLAYAGRRKILTYLSMVITGISQLLALAPFLYIWAILRDVIAGDYSRIGRKDATDEEVIAAAKLAHVDVFAEKLPDGWNSLIEENGSELSGGERQRISIARAFLKDAPIILLDEATASLDVENETFIQESLSRLVKDKTVIIIAHRMRTEAGADKIVVLKEGKVDECGSPSELTSSGGFYKRMKDLQGSALEWNI